MVRDKKYIPKIKSSSLAQRLFLALLPVLTCSMIYAQPGAAISEFHTLHQQSPPGVNSHGIEAYGITEDPYNDIIVTGGYSEFAYFNQQQITGHSPQFPSSRGSGFVMKMDQNGGVVWFKQIPASNEASCRIQSVVTDSTGNIYIGGTVHSSTDSIYFDSVAIPHTNNNIEVFTAKLNPQGDLLWLHHGGRSNTLTPVSLSLINNSLYLSFKYGEQSSQSAVFGGQQLLASNAQNSNFLLTKLTLNGTFQWMKFGEGHTIGASSIPRIYVDEHENIYLTASLDSVTYDNTVQFDSSFNVIKFDSSGNYIDHFELDLFVHYTEPRITGVDDRIFVGLNAYPSIYYTPSIYMSGFNILKFDDNLNLVDYENIGTNAPFSAWGSDNMFDVSDDGSLMICGEFGGAMLIGNTNITGSGGALFLKMDTNLVDLDWYFKSDNPVFNNPGDMVRGFTQLSTGNFMLVGNLRTQSTWGPFSANIPGNDYEFISRVVECQSITPQVTPDSVFLCGNNPQVTIKADQYPNHNLQWLAGTTPVQGASADSFTVNSPGDYRLKTDSMGCLDTSDVIQVALGDSTNVQLSQDSIEVCAGDSAFNLSFGSPSGGIWKGNGIINDTFFVPDSVNPGNYPLKYVYNNPPVGYCPDSADLTVTVHALPNTFVFPIPDQCTGDAPVNLTNYAFPQGASGTFTGNGIQGNYFHPSTAGAGVSLIQYAYTNSAGCSDSTLFSINVTQSPQVTLNPFASVCEAATQMSLSGNSPAGGNWSGDFVMGGQFHPSAAGPGTHSITYSVTNNGCTSSATQNIVVDFDTAQVSAPASVCHNDSAFIIQTLPGGGIFSGDFSDSLVEPSMLTPGNQYTIQYSIQNTCGTDTTQATLSIDTVPQVTLNFSQNRICATDSAVNLSGGLPSGGIFTGQGVSHPYFDPQITGQGTHPVHYIYQDANGCADTATQNINVEPEPQVNWNIQDSICLGAAPLQLNGGTPSGGIYSGDSVTSNTFDPSVGTGAYHLIYTYVDSFGCTASDSNIIHVYDEPNPVWQAPDICENDGQLTLVGGTPSGGVFSGNGVSGSEFDPSLTGTGAHPVTYTVSTSCGQRAVTDSIQVNSAPAVSWNGFTDICETDTNISFTTGQPSGGTYFVNGNVASGFNPDSAGAGTHQLSYVFQDSLSCSDTVQRTITVHPLTQVSFTLQDSICVNNGLLSLSGSPAGGVFSGPGVSGSNFDPLIGTGSYSINYTFTNANGCVSVDTQSITVYDVPDPLWSEPGRVCENGDSLFLGTPSPAGGVFSGNGVAGTHFIPSAAGTGEHPITYTIQTSCGAKFVVDTIRVDSVPNVTLDPFNDLCENVSLVNPSGGTPAGGDYFVNGNVHNATLPGNYGIGTHQLSYTFTDQYGCTSSDTQSFDILEKPHVVFESDPVCINDSVGKLSGATPPGGTFSGSNITSNMFDPQSAGTGAHLVVYTFADSNGCETNDWDYVEVVDTPSVSLSLDTASVCESGQPFSLSGGIPAGGVFTGTGVDSGYFDPAGLNPDDYDVNYQITDSNDCSSLTRAEVTVFENPAFDLSDESLCRGEDLTLSASDANTYSWNTGDSTKNITVSPDSAALYRVSVTSDEGCTVTDSAFVTVHKRPRINIGSDTTVCLGDTMIVFTRPEFASYYWSTGSKMSAVIIATGELGPGDHWLSLMVTDSNNCTAQDGFNLTVDPCDVGLEELEADVSVSVYPNPSRGQFLIDLEGTVKDEGTIQLVSLNGKSLYTKSFSFSGGKEQIEFNPSEIATGTYFIVINGNKIHTVKQVVISR